MKRKDLPRLTSFPLLVALLVIVTVTFATAGSPPIDVHGTSWYGFAKASGKVTAPGQKAEKIKGAMVVEVHFGEQTSPVLDTDDYLVILDDGSITVNFSGTFTQTKGKIVLNPDLAALGAELEDLMDSVVGGNWTCNVIKLKAKAKVKNKKSGPEMKFKFMCKWRATEVFSPNMAKSKLKIKAKLYQ